MPSWQQQACPIPQALRGVWAINATTVVAVGDSGRVLRTVDGGANWTVININYNTNVNGVCFANANLGWLVGHGGLIMRSNNGGASWTLDKTVTGAIFRGVHVILVGMQYNGLAVGDSGQVQAMISSGWTTKNHAGNPMLRGASVVPSSIGQGWEGWACGNPSNPATSGQLSWFNGAWQGYTNYNTPFNDVSLVNKDLGWCCGNGGTIRKKTVGPNWTLQNTPPGTPKLNSIWMLSDGQQGCCVGDTGTLLWCTGGGTWAAMANPMPPPAPALNGVHFLDATTGWAVGNAAGGQGTILKYS